MRTAYLANVGTQDVQLDGAAPKFPRDDGERWLAAYEEKRAQLTAPILERGLTYVLERVARVDRVALFATDQPDDKYRGQDTIALGRILQRLLRDRFGDHIGRVDCLVMQCNPADYDRTHAFFKDQLRHQVSPADFEAVWIAPVGGTPASNSGLLLNGIRLYGSRCQAIYVPPGSARIQSLSLHQEILAQFAREEAKAHLDRRDFIALREVMTRARLGEPWHHELCTYADCRGHFDFVGARQALDRAQMVADGAEARSWITRCVRSLEPFLDGTVHQPDSSSGEQDWLAWFSLQQACLGELFFNLRLKARRGEWIDFLGRTFRLNEAMLRLTFEMATRHSTEEKNYAYVDFTKLVKSDPEAVEHFKQRSVSDRRVDTRSLRTWLELAVSRDASAYAPLLACSDRVRSLSQLRHKSILAHGYHGVSREAIEATLMKPVEAFIEEDLRDLLTRLGVSVREDRDPLGVVLARLEEV